MPIQPGTRLGPYEITAAIGAGGMGEVYRARDTKLDRDVAIKVLPEDFATDQDRVARFEREAKLLASLSHANIATIHGLEDSDGVRFIAMECVEGETLAERIARSGRIEIDDALEIARQIAEALEAAHESGIVHRDLKPANVIVAPDGKVKVLDFGLAKAWETDAASGLVGAGTAGTSPEGATAADLSHSPTILDATRTGVILGTAAYMSPEQARGKPVDKRTDIWAFGCVLNEMLAGRRAFSGETVSDTLAAILKEDPDLDALPDELTPGARQLLLRCLDKDPRLRLRDIGEARFWLGSLGDDFGSTPGGGVEVGPTSRRLSAVAAVVVALVAVASFFGGAAYRDARTASESRQNLPIATAEDANFGYWFDPVLALSPDGRWLAYVAESAGDPKLFVQDLVGGAPARLIPKTDDAAAPFFSPDSESIAFFQGVTLQTVRVAAGEPTERATVGTTHPGGAWAEDDSMLVVPSFGGPVQSIDAQGAVIDEIQPEVGERFLYPATLPGDERFLVSVHTNSRRSVVVMGWDGSRTLVADPGYYGRYVPTGHILWMRDNELVAATFDLDTMTAGAPEVVARNVVADRLEGFGEYGVADDGTIAYLEAEPGGEWLQLLRPGGAPETLNSNALDLAYIQLDVSPLGDLVAYSDDNLPPNIHLFDLGRKAGGEALVASPNFDFGPLFSPDGTRVAYIAVGEDDSWAFYETTTNAPGEPVELLASGASKWTGGWSPDGETLTFFQEHAEGTGLMLLKPRSREDPTVFLDTPAREDFPLFSADGNWIIYTSDQAGRSEIYARAYPTGPRVLLSTEGGRQAKVDENGTVFFRNGEIVMSVELPDPGTLSVVPAVEFVRGVDSAAWDVLPDGSGVIAVQRRPQPQVRLILRAAQLFPQR